MSTENTPPTDPTYPDKSWGHLMQWLAMQDDEFLHNPANVLCGTYSDWINDCIRVEIRQIAVPALGEYMENNGLELNTLSPRMRKA